MTVSATLEDQHKLISSSSKGSTPTDTVYWRADPALCVLSDLTGFVTKLAASCAEGEQLAYEAPECTDGYALPALFRAQRLPSGNVGAAELVSDGTCVTPAELVTAAAQAFASLPIEPSPLHVQPPDGWTLINVDTITYTEDVPQDFETELLGVPVTIRAVPSTFAWDYDDGTAPLLTEHPGAAYPDNTVGHTYTAPGEVSIGLTTTWRGQFQVVGTPAWTDVPGEASTSTTTGSITVHEARTRLVEDPAG